MNAQEAGFGHVIPWPRFLLIKLGDIVSIDEEGVLRTMGSMFDDTHFKMLEDQSPHTMDRSSTVEEHPAMTVAFTTGCVDVKPLSEEEASRYLIVITIAKG